MKSIIKLETFVRDKDVFQAAAIIAEAAAYYKSMKNSLYDRLMILFDTYDYYEETMTSITIKGQKGIEQISQILNDLRANLPLKFGGVTVIKREDYQSRARIYTVEETYEMIDLPRSIMLKYDLQDSSWIAVRPSGTEPKIKFYFAVTGSSMKENNRVAARGI